MTTRPDASYDVGRDARWPTTVSVGIGSLGPIVLFVDDLAVSKAFYCDTLGLTLRGEDADSAVVGIGDEILLLLDPSAADGLLAGHPIAPPRRGAAPCQFNFFVDDVDATHAALVAKGVAFLVDPVDRPWGRRTAHFHDPDGFIWEISAPID